MLSLDDMQTLNTLEGDLSRIAVQINRLSNQDERCALASEHLVDALVILASIRMGKTMPTEAK